MNKNKKIFFIFLAIIIVLIALILVITSKREQNIGEQNGEGDVTKNFIEKTTFEEREDIIKNLLMNKYKADEGVEVLIARESDNHINGIFFIENMNNEEFFQGKFFAIINQSIEVVWSGDGPVDCEIISRYNFPLEMAQGCF